MSEMIERAANAIAYARGGFTSMASDYDRELARAAIEALREPTREMVMEGGKRMCDGPQDGAGDHPLIYPSHIWQGMIDAAIDETPDD